MGCFSMAIAQAFANRADTEMPSGLTFLYMDSNEVISMSVLTRNAGTVNVATMLLLTAFCIPVKGTKPSGNSTAASPEGAFLRSAFLSPVAIFTSSTVTRPREPVPTMVARSSLAFFAAARAMGVAAMTPGAGVQTGLVGAAAAAAGLAAAGAPFLAAFSTSAAVILPSGPVPATMLRSRPISSAFFLANGEATIRAPGARATGAAGAAALEAAAAGAAGAATAGGAAPDSVAA
mmetsp:Transcript_10735/g.31305  ORF Transcript_10735/g.31305 Transcript_10735/m.31305 type:complete len:234 (+) Transcript_10735:556-1257(+)